MPARPSSNPKPARFSNAHMIATSFAAVAGVAIAAALVALVMSWSRGGNTTDLGAVSSQWIAEHRLGSGQDSRR